MNPTGYLCEAWFDQTPALRVNEDASEAALLAWCCAEVQALCASAHAFNMALEHDDPQALCGDDTFAKVFMHRLAPLERMLEMLATRKQLEWRESSR